MKPFKFYHVASNGLKKAAILLYEQDSTRRKQIFNESKICTKPNALTRQIKQILEKAAQARQNISQQDVGVKHIWL